MTEMTWLAHFCIVPKTINLSEQNLGSYDFRQDYAAHTLCLAQLCDCTVEIWFVFEYDIMTWLLVTGLPGVGGEMVVLVEAVVQVLKHL